MMLHFVFRLTGSVLLGAALAHAAIVVDAGRIAPPPADLPFRAGGRSPAGHTVAINSRYLSLDGKPWFPVMGEFQYSRYPAADWERELLKMKAGGVQIVSTYVFWIHHEEIEGRFDWSGRRDLHRFVELAGKHGLYVWVRIGPWDHGEVRNGGLPDWLLRNTAARSNDPAYLKSVARFYDEIARQLKGCFWKDGGPVIGVQIENEYHERGPGKGEEHILTLQRLAREAGFDAPFYSITGWDDAAMPARGVIPVFGGYPDGFWYRSLAPLPPSPNYFFTPIRCEENVADDLSPRRPDIDARFTGYPFLTAEMAGGMAVAYHRRPLMTADDIAALDVVKLGAGVTLYGYYMFHGGTNPDGRETPLQESQATGYPNDLPRKGYDFQAPLGEFGQMRPSFRALKAIHLFLHDFGSELAPMAAYFPESKPAGRLDRDTPRIAVRANAKNGFIFINNYEKNAVLPPQKRFQVQVKLPSRTVTAPSHPITLPGGAYTFWPVEMPLGGAVLEYATAQPLCRIEGTVVFFAWPGVEPEFAFHTSGGLSVEAPQARVSQANGRIYVTGIRPGLDTAIRVRTGDHETRIVVATREQAGNLWKARLAARERLVYSSADLYFEGDRIRLSAADPAALTLGISPKPERTPAGFRRSGEDGIFARYTTAAEVERVAIEPAVRQLAKAGTAPPVRMGKEVATVPTDECFQAAARWTIRVPKVKSAAVGNLLLRISYVGDIARLYAGGRLVTDDFYHGVPWEIGLSHIAEADLELQILPWRGDAPIYIGGGLRPVTPAGGQTATLTGVTVVPEYQVTADLQP